MTIDAIKFTSESLETLIELAKTSVDECSSVFHENRLASFRRIVTASRAKVPHGKWAEWVQETFSGRLSMRTVQRWISEAAR